MSLGDKGDIMDKAKMKKAVRKAYAKAAKRGSSCCDSGKKSASPNRGHCQTPRPMPYPLINHKIKFITQPGGKSKLSHENKQGENGKAIVGDGHVGHGSQKA